MLQLLLFFFFKQKTEYEMRISDWSSDVCSSDLEDALELSGREIADGVVCKAGEADFFQCLRNKPPARAGDGFPDADVAPEAKRDGVCDRDRKADRKSVV